MGKEKLSKEGILGSVGALRVGRRVAGGPVGAGGAGDEREGGT